MVFRFLAKFPTVSEYELALKHLKKGRGAYFVFRDYAQQILQQEDLSSERYGLRTQVCLQ